MKNRIKIFSFILTGMLILGPFLSCSGAVSPDGHDEEPAEQPSNTDTNKPSAVTNFTVTFNSDGGTAIAPQTVRKGSLVTRPADPQKEGYLFLGWFISDILYDFSSPVNSNITLTAKWELPNLEDIYITSSTQDIIQTIKDYEQPEDAEHPDTINIYVIGQIDQTKLTQINTGIIEWAEGYYKKNSENPSLKINLDLQYSTGITELNSNSITLGKSDYEADLNYIVKLSPHTSYIATDALTGLNSSKIKFLIEEKLYTFTAPENGVLKLYDEQRKNTLSFANGIALKALENGVNVSFFKDKIWLSTAGNYYYPVQLTVGQDTIYFYYFTTDFENNIAKYFIPFSDANKDFKITFYPTGTTEATSIQVKALGGLGFPLKQAFFDTTLEVSCTANPDQASVQINTSANSLSDWFVAPNLLNNNWRPTIYCNFYAGDNNWYASNNITLANDNSFAYLRDNTIKGVTNNNSVSLSNYILQDCSAKITLEFYLNDEHNTVFSIDPYITASAAISEQWKTSKTLNISPDKISNISAITENTQIILRERSGKYFSNSDLQAVADALRQLSLTKPDLRIALELPAFQNITVLESNLFRDCTILTVFKFPPEIIGFGYHCFENCNNLRRVDYTGTLEEWLSIYFEAQSNPCCHNAVLYIDNKPEPITDVTIPATITTLNAYAFSSCESLKTVTIPDTVLSIGPSAFSTCHNLESVTISNNSPLTEIGSYAFLECYKLTEITIPEDVTRIDSRAFQGCSNLNAVNFAETTNWYVNSEQQGIKSSILSKPKSAAKLLTDTYANYDWGRKQE